jgi:aspartate/methionine/tyrosine aminotransferase
VQRASIAAWEDEAHVEEARARYAAKRAALLPALQAAGLELVGGDASFFLWLSVPDGDDEGLASRWLEHGVVLAPGSYLGAGGEGHVRAALVPTVEACRRAAAVVASLGA